MPESGPNVLSRCSSGHGSIAAAGPASLAATCRRPLQDPRFDRELRRSQRARSGVRMQIEVLAMCPATIQLQTPHDTCDMGTWKGKWRTHGRGIESERTGTYTEPQCPKARAIRQFVKSRLLKVQVPSWHGVRCLPRKQTLEPYTQLECKYCRSFPG